MPDQSVANNTSGADLSQVPPMRSFEFDANVVGKLKSSVNQFRGSVAMPVDFFTLPGRDGLDVKVAAVYSSAVRQAAACWNVEAPTGILGLGWQMPVEMITVSKGGSAGTNDDTYFLLSAGSASELVKMAEDATGRWMFQLESYQFWDIRYDPRLQTWTIVHENGFVYTYGGLDPEAKAVQWGISWGNWLGSSVRLAGQQRFPVAWNLASVASPAGARVSYAYTAVEAHVGAAAPLTYTRASYLERVTDSYGRVVRFSYAEKFGADHPSPDGGQIVEYRARHPGPRAGNAYQDKFETRYLSTIEVSNADGSTASTLNFRYSFINVGASGAPGYPLLWKRVLAAVYQSTPDGSALPGLEFAYYEGQTDLNRGALKHVTDPSGAVTRYVYKANPINAPKALTLPNPLPGSTPGVWHGDDYVAFSYCLAGGAMRLLACSWNGQWVSHDLTVQALRDVHADPDSVRVLCAPAYLALTLRNQAASRDELYIFRKDPTRFGAWVLYNGQPLTLNLKAGSAPAASSIVAGADFVVAYNPGYTAGAFQAFSYDWRTRMWSTPSAMPSPAMAAAADGVVLAVAERCYLVAFYTGARQQLRFALFYRDLAGAWHAASEWTTDKLTILSSGGVLQLALQAQSGAAVATYVTAASATAISYSVSLYQWDQSFTVLNGATPETVALSNPVSGSTPQFSSIQTVTSGASVANNLAHLRNLGGGAGPGNQNWVLTQLANPGAGVTPLFAAGADVAVMCANQGGRQRNTLLTFDPNRPDQAGWQVSAAIDQNGRAATVGGDYMTVGATVYSRSLSGTWQPLGAQLYRLGAQDTVQNRGGRYIAYQDNDDSQAVSYVVMLANGDAEAAVPLPGGAQKICVPAAQARAGSTLAGPRFLVSYPAAAAFAHAPSLTLYCLDGGPQTQYEIDYPVAWVEIDNPCAPGLAYVQSFFYSNSAQSQVAYNAATGVAQYPLVVVVPGVRSNAPLPPAAQPQGRSQYFYSNGLSAQASLNYPTGTVYNYQKLLNGMLLARYDYDAAGAQVASELNYWNVSASDANRGSFLYGAYVRLLSTTSMRDGVQGFSVTGYDARTGLQSTQEQTYTDADGQAMRLRSATTYACQVAACQAAFLGAHLLTAQVMTTKSVRPQLGGSWKAIESEVTTWRDWSAQAGRPHLAPLAVYRWTGPGEPAFDFGAAEQPGWVRRLQVVQRNDSGLIVEQADLNGIPSSYLYDKDGTRLVAKFPNGSVSGGEVAYCGFAHYEAAHGWELGAGAAIVPNPDHPVIDAHSGRRSMRLAPGAAMRRSFTPRRQDQAYVFSAWVKTPDGFDPAAGAARWTITVGGVPAATLAFPAATGTWQYLMQAIALPGAAPASVVIECINANDALAVLVDDLRFSPLNCLFDATAYAPGSWLPNATLSANGETSRTVYDAFQRPVLTTNAGDRLARVSAAAFSRSVNGGSFVPSAPNASLAIRLAQGGALSTFTRGADWQAQWAAPAGAWQQAGGRLTQGAGPDALLALTAPSCRGDFAVAVNFTPLDPVDAAFGLRLPKALTVQWNPEALDWELLDAAGKLLESAATMSLLTLPLALASALDGGVVTEAVSAAFAAAGVPLAPGSAVMAGRAGRWTLAAPDRGYFYYLAASASAIAVHRPGSNWIALAGARCLLFWVDGQQVFSYQSALRLDCLPELFFGSRVAITSLAAGSGAQAAATFADTRGVAIQAQALADDGRAICSQTIPDSNGRRAVSTKAAYVGAAACPLLSYCADFAAMDWETGAVSGLVAACYPDDAGFPYARVRYEASPLGRVIEQGMPGAPFRLGAHSTRIAYTSIAAGAPGCRFHQTETTDQNGNRVCELSNELGQIVGKSSLTAGAPVRNATRFDEAGNPVELRAPNHYAPPAGSVAADWITTQCFDHAGRLLRTQTGSQPARSSIYDRAGNLRFVHDGVDAAAATVHYIKYDALNRPREQGVVAAGWDRAQLQGFADTDPGWPAAAPGWRKRYLFDGAQAGQHSIGRVYQVQVNSGDDSSVVTETYAYDIFGNTSTRSVVAATVPRQSVEYRFDNAGNITSIGYPPAPNGGGLTVDYRINRLNQVEAIARGGNFETPLASFSYQANGRPLGQQLSLGERGAARLGFSFNAPLWISAIHATDDDGATLFGESLAYAGQGVGDAGYYDGSVAAAGYRFAAGTLPDNQFAYAYNELGQLTQAESTLDAGLDLGVPAPVRYDPNGNFISATLGATVRDYEYAAGTQQVARVRNAADQALLASYSYDANGNALTSESAASPFAGAHRLAFAYDAGTAMTSSITDKVADARLDFTYDSYDRRLVKTVTLGDAACMRKVYVRGMNALPLLELSADAAGTSATHYIYGPGGLVAMLRDGACYGIIKDHLGSVRAVLDADARVVASYDYLSFGALSAVIEPTPGFMPYLFTGQEYDREIELYNYQARFYAPELGRFLGVDPRRQYFSPYLYAANNPVLYIDPTGEFSIGSLFSAIGGLLIGAVEILIGAVIDLIAGVLEAVTGGLATPASIALASLAGAFYGAGTGAIAYSVFNFDNFDWRDYGIQMGIGALAGAITFGFGAAGEAAGEGLTQVAALGEAASNSARFANYAIQTAATTAGGVAANSVAQSISNVASGVAPGADIGNAIMWGAIGDVAGSVFPSASYKAGYGNLGKRVLLGVGKAEVLGVAGTLAQNAANGSPLADGLVESMFAGAMAGSLDGLKVKDATTNSMERGILL